MPQIPPIQDAYIDQVIKAPNGFNPNITKTQGAQLRELFKLMRDRFEQEIAETSALEISDTAPVNTGKLWYDTTVVSGVKLKYYDSGDTQWKLISQAASPSPDISTGIIDDLDDYVDPGDFSIDIPASSTGNGSVGVYISVNSKITGHVISDQNNYIFPEDNTGHVGLGLSYPISDTLRTYKFNIKIELDDPGNSDNLYSSTLHLYGTNFHDFSGTFKLPYFIKYMFLGTWKDNPLPAILLQLKGHLDAGRYADGLTRNLIIIINNFVLTTGEAVIINSLIQAGWQFYISGNSYNSSNPAPVTNIT